ncbi:MAG TPA: hypothetical protein VHV08_17645 [Pirellulales bacterium]|jgi:hypothetical protein|nr:hypothetical protein [Pirellulales bacterium]
MPRIIAQPTKPEDHAALRRELLKLIVKNESQRREERKAARK